MHFLLERTKEFSKQMTKFRDLIRKRRVSKHVNKNGWYFSYHNINFQLPSNTEINVANALIKGNYEKEEVQMISSHVPPDKSVIELGGSFGIVSGLISKNLNKGVEHIIVEANPLLSEVCLKNAQAGSSNPNITLVQKAICYSEKIIEFKIAKNPHSSSIFELPDKKVNKIVKITSITLNEIYKSLENQEDYTLICDIEGGEEEIARYDIDTIAKAKTVIMELHPSMLQNRQSQIPILMRDKGFSIKEQIGNVFSWARN